MMKYSFEKFYIYIFFIQYIPYTVLSYKESSIVLLLVAKLKKRRKILSRFSVHVSISSLEEYISRKTIL